MYLIEHELKQINKKYLKRKTIMLMGRIEHVQTMLHWLKTHGYQVDSIIDNDVKKQGIEVDGIHIRKPEEVLLPYNQQIVVIIYSPKYWEEMVEQLSAYGYVDKKQLLVLDRPSWQKNIKQVELGLHLYRKMQEQYGKRTHFFLANCPLGDYYLLCSYLGQFCNREKIKDYVVIGESAGIEKLSDLFGIQNAERVTTQQSNALIATWKFLGAEKVRITPLTIWQGPFRFNSCLTRQKAGFSFHDTFDKMIYGLGNQGNPYYPEFYYKESEIKKIFEKYHFQKGQTILLVPHTYSMQTLPMKFWEELSQSFIDLGFQVAVNIGDQREQNPIPNTVTMELDFNHIAGFMEQGGIVIGMRCGFFDITAQVKCTRIIIYPKASDGNVAWNSTDMSFCSLKSMGLCNTAYELEVTDTNILKKKIVDIVKQEIK